MSWLRTEIERVMQESMPNAFTIGIVQSISGNMCKVDPINGDPTMFNVRLNLDSSTVGIALVPKVGSVVLVGLINGNKKNPFIAMYSEVESIKLNGDANGGLIKIEELVSKMNALENDLNQVKTLIAAWVPVPTDGGASLKATLAAWTAAQLTPTTKLNLENTKVTHG